MTQPRALCGDAESGRRRGYGEIAGEGVTRRLPLICATRDGFRLGSIEYEVG